MEVYTNGGYFLFVSFGCSKGSQQEEMLEREEEIVSIEETWLEEPMEFFTEEQETVSNSCVLEELEGYLKELIVEGRLEELEPFTISHRIRWEEAARWADDSPYFAHFTSYGSYEFWSEGVILLQVDLNRDGIADWIEYLPQAEKWTKNTYYNPYSLTIYLSEEKEDYQITYYQPNFLTDIEYYDSAFVIQYQNCDFLVLENNHFDSYVNSSNLDINRFSIYQIEEGILTERLELNYEYGTVLATIQFCTEEQKERAAFFCQEAETCYRARRVSSFLGEKEEFVSEHSEEYGLLRELGYKQEEEKKEIKEWEKRYQERYGKEYSFQFEYMNWGYGWRLQSDLDQDGEKELYVKWIGDFQLWIQPTESEIERYCYPTGELYQNGKYEGKRGLKYFLVKDGKVTDFQSLCGLELWSDTYMPYMFWIEEQEGEAITYFKYYDDHYYRSLIEGYRIQEGSYETVLSVLYQPEIEFTCEYEKKTEEEKENVLTYMICMEGKDINIYPRIYGLEDKEWEKELNEKIELFIRQERGNYLKRQDYLEDDRKIEEVGTRIISTTKEKVVFGYYICKFVKFESVVDFEVDLKTGKIRNLGWNYIYSKGEASW